MLKGICVDCVRITFLIVEDSIVNNWPVCIDEFYEMGDKRIRAH
jgi:hypothetical protein